MFGGWVIGEPGTEIRTHWHSGAEHSDGHRRTDGRVKSYLFIVAVMACGSVLPKGYALITNAPGKGVEQIHQPPLPGTGEPGIKVKPFGPLSWHSGLANLEDLT